MIPKGYEAVHIAEPLLFYRQHSAEQANTLLLHTAALIEFQVALEQSWAWSQKLQRDIDEIVPYASKLERELEQLKQYILHCEQTIQRLKG